MQEIQEKAQEAASFLKGLANSHRLVILCLLLQEEQSVGQLVEATGVSRTSMSQHLGKLKEEGIVDYRREHRTLYYRIDSPDVLRIMQVLEDLFCHESSVSK